MKLDRSIPHWRCVLSVLALWLAAAGAFAQGVRAEDGWAVEVVDSAFGVYTQDRAGNTIFHRTRMVPYTPGRGAFGWVVSLRTQRATVRWREELTLPAPPATWGDPPADGTRRISADGRTVILEREGAASPFLFQTWQVAPGDPRGLHQIRLSIDGAAPLVFDFEIQ